MKKWPTTRDTLLVKLVEHDQHLAWHEFHDIYEPVVFRYGRQQGLQHADALELTQRVMIKVMQAAESWAETGTPDRFRSWLKTVATNTLINLVTREAKYRASGDSKFTNSLPAQDSTLENWDAEAHRSILRLAAKRVRPKFNDLSWKAFEMTLLQGVSVSATASRLSTSTGAVYAARSRIIRALKLEVARINYFAKESPDAKQM